MNVRNFYDTERRKYELFMEEVESGTYRPMGLRDPDLTPERWQECFKQWLASRN